MHIDGNDREPSKEINGSTSQSDRGGDVIGKGKGGRSPNDQRADALNPNNPEHADAQDNRADQLNPNNEAYRSSRDKNEEEEE